MKKKMKMMMSEQKDPAAIHYPQLDSEQRKNEEEEEEPSSKPIQTLPLPFSKEEEKKRAKRKEKKIEFENLAAGLRDQQLLHKIQGFFFQRSGIPDEPRY